MVMTPEEGRDQDRLSRGEAVPDHPAACAGDGCGHAQIWHRHRGRTKPCQQEGCACQDLVRKPSARLTADASLGPRVR